MNRRSMVVSSLISTRSQHNPWTRSRLALPSGRCHHLSLPALVSSSHRGHTPSNTVSVITIHAEIESVREKSRCTLEDSRPRLLTFIVGGKLGSGRHEFLS